MRKILIGALAAVVGAAVIPSIASADVTALSVTNTVSPAKQFKKVRGGVTTTFVSKDTHSGITLPPGGPGCDPPPFGSGSVTAACKYFPPSVQSVITFPTDFKFTPGKLPACNLASLQGKDAAGAKAACPRSVVGQGNTHIHTTTETGGPSGNGQLSGVVTLFNGAPTGGRPSLYVHIDIAGNTNKPILTGSINGNVLTTTIPPVPGTVIEDLTATINKLVVKKSKGVKTFYLSARCSRKTWALSETNTYQGGKQLTASTSGKCKQLKQK
jgi:hypothetical protein